MQNSETLRVVWDGDSETDCVEVCRDLMRAGIVYKVAQQPVSRSSRMEVIWRFQVGVLGSDYESAREALGLNVPDNEIVDQAFEIPESVGPISESSRLEHRKRATSYLEPWDPKKATSEVWSQNASDTSSIAELALRENLIHHRIDSAKDGKRTFFVAPEDEPRAREILREIKKGEPPA